MRFYEILAEHYVEPSPERLALLPIIYGDLVWEKQVEELEALRLANERQRAEIAQIRAETETAMDPLADELIRAKIDKMRADALAMRAKS
ncbi:hypothetical protein [Sphingobium bisphenolivorans]|uniref:hypothetical protein n=1 Tax=Sphingobium bisphenolivorans TaxID=1335760 RepID=UPI0003B5356E|nr:hypothetical protein [Sphingobium bisphenolivorans]